MGVFSALERYRENTDSEYNKHRAFCNKQEECQDECGAYHDVCWKIYKYTRGCFVQTGFHMK